MISNSVNKHVNYTSVSSHLLLNHTVSSHWIAPSSTPPTLTATVKHIYQGTSSFPTHSPLRWWLQCTPNVGIASTYNMVNPESLHIRHIKTYNLLFPILGHKGRECSWCCKKQGHNILCELCVPPIYVIFISLNFTSQLW
jgi:hypothetical protein